MASEVENMFYRGKTPWHGLGKKIPDNKDLSMKEAIVAAGLDWQVSLKTVFTYDDQEQPSPVSDMFACCRQSDNRVLGIVGKDYKPLQNNDAFAWFQPFLDSGEAFLETAGSLKGGKRIWILARANTRPLIVSKKDEICNYILLSNAHDGSLSVSVGFVPIRVVCNNTLSMAHQSRASTLLRVRHTGEVVKNLEVIRETMDLAKREFQATVEQYSQLCRRSINHADLIKYVSLVFQTDADKSTKIIPAVSLLFEHGRGSDVAGKTLWGAYNAVNEYLNYGRGKTQDNTLNSLWFGSSADINRRALQIALKMAA